MTDKLTNKVLEYQSTRSNEAFDTLANLSEGLIYGVAKFYHLEILPRAIQEEIINDCKSIILLKAVNSFDVIRGAKFSTHYVWRLKSHIRSKKEFYQRRYQLINALSLDARIAGGGEHNPITLENKLHTFKTNIKTQINKEINNIFNK
jgi:hypothetical protein